jgi:hypothetical protein
VRVVSAGVYDVGVRSEAFTLCVGMNICTTFSVYVGLCR